MKGMHRICDAQQIWPGEVRKDLFNLGNKASILHPCRYPQTETHAFAVGHKHDLSCVGFRLELGNLCECLKKSHGLKGTMFRGARRRRS